MPKRNKRIDVFLHIDMTGGANTCWEWKRPLHRGRPYFDAEGRRQLAYRTVYELVKGVELDRDTVVRHKCDNPKCCNPSHLETGSHQQNMDDMVERERHGVPHHVVRAIRKLKKDGENGRILTDKEIAERYGLARRTVSAIISGYRREKVGDEGETTQATDDCGDHVTQSDSD